MMNTSKQTDGIGGGDQTLFHELKNEPIVLKVVPATENQTSNNSVIGRYSKFKIDDTAS